MPDTKAMHKAISYLRDAAREMRSVGEPMVGTTDCDEYGTRVMGCVKSIDWMADSVVLLTSIIEDSLSEAAKKENHA